MQLRARERRVHVPGGSRFSTLGPGRLLGCAVPPVVAGATTAQRRRCCRQWQAGQAWASSICPSRPATVRQAGAPDGNGHPRPHTNKQGAAVCACPARRVLQHVQCMPAEAAAAEARLLYSQQADGQQPSTVLSQRKPQQHRHSRRATAGACHASGQAPWPPPPVTPQPASTCDAATPSVPPWLAP